MDIRILGAHNYETQTTKCVSFLIDETLAIDAGGLTSSLSIPAQQKLRAIMLTHQHYDHIRDIPMIAINLYSEGTSINVYCSPIVRDIIEAHLLNGKLYPKFQELPAAKPTINFTTIEPYIHRNIEGYDILPISVNHGNTTFGYQVTDIEDRVMFYTADTGPGLIHCWQRVVPQLLIIEVSTPNKYEETAIEMGHLTPSLLNQQLITFREIRGYLPQVIVVHMDPKMQGEIETELAAVARALNTTITVAYEGMQLHI